eukprot:6225748-Amphidinium_carterae.1
MLDHQEWSLLSQKPSNQPERRASLPRPYGSGLGDQKNTEKCNLPFPGHVAVIGNMGCSNVVRWAPRASVPQELRDS